MVKSNNNSAAFLLLLLFLVLATFPVAVVFAHYYGVLPLPQLDYGSVMVFATAALFLLPVFFVLLAAVAVLLKKGKERGGAVGVVAKRAPKPERYPWEDVFRIREVEEREFAPRLTGLPRREVNIRALAVAVFVAAITVAFLLVFVPKVNDVIFRANITAEVLAEEQAVEELNLTKVSEKAVKAAREDLLSRLLKQNLTSVQKAKPKVEPETEAKPAAAVAIAAKAKLAATAKAFAKSVAEVKGAVKKAVSYAKAKAKASLQASLRYWHYAAIVIGALLMAGALFCGYRTKKLTGLLAVVAAMVKVIAAVAGKNKTKLLVVVTAAASLAVLVLAFVFREWLVAKLSGAVGVLRLSAAPAKAAGLFSAAKDFLSAYRLYIAIGVVALAVILGILFLLERREKGKGKGQGLKPAPAAPKKSSR